MRTEKIAQLKQFYHDTLLEDIVPFCEAAPSKTRIPAVSGTALHLLPLLCIAYKPDNMAVPDTRP